MIHSRAMSSCMRTVDLMTNILSDERATSKLHVCSREPRTIAQYNHSKFAYLIYMHICKSVYVDSATEYRSALRHHLNDIFFTNGSMKTSKYSHIISQHPIPFA